MEWKMFERKGRFASAKQRLARDGRKEKPRAFYNTLSMLKPRFESLPTYSLGLLRNEERKAVKAHQLEVERKRWEAIVRARRITFR